MPNVTVKDLLEAGVHFGHQTKRWNPKMRPYVYGSRNGIYIIDLQQTAQLAKKACTFAKKVSSEGKKVLFVGTKKQARDIVAHEAQRSDQYFVTSRWLGGTMTNYQTIRASVDRLKRLTQMRDTGEMETMNKKHVSRLEKQREKLERNLGGIREMRKLPGAVFIIDPNKEQTAVLEAKKLGIPTIGIVDTNCDPTGVDFVIPGNDDAIKSIRLFCSLIADSCIEGNQEFQAKLRSKDVKVEDEGPQQEQQVSRFEGHVDIASPDLAEIELEEEEKRKAEEAKKALEEAKAEGVVEANEEGVTVKVEAAPDADKSEE